MIATERAIVRPATVEDVPAVVAMALRFLRETRYGAVIAENPTQLDHFARFLIAQPSGALLVLETDRVVGMIGLLVAPHYLSGEQIATEVCWWVDPEHRGEGRRLMAAAEGWAQAHGAVVLHMVAPTERIGKLYERAGYQFVESAYGKRWS